MFTSLRLGRLRNNIDLSANANLTVSNLVGVEINTQYSTGTLTLSGLSPNTNITLTATGGTIDAGTNALSGTSASSKTVTTSASGTIVIRLTLTSSGSFSTAVSMSIAITGGTLLDNIWMVTTRAVDVNANLTLTNVTDAELGQTYSTGMLTMSGLDPNYTYSDLLVISSTESGVTAGTGTIDAGTTSLSGTTSNVGKVFTTTGSGTAVLQVTNVAPNEYNTTVNLWLRGIIFSPSFVWSLTTKSLSSSIVTPPASSPSYVSPSTVVTSSTVNLTGLDGSRSYTLTASGGTVDAGTTSLSGTFASSKTVTSTAGGSLVFALRGTSSASYNATTSVTLSLASSGGVPGTINGASTYTWNINTIDNTASTSGSYTNVTGATVNTVYVSNTVKLVGLSPSTSYTFAAAVGNCSSNNTGATITTGFATTTSVTTNASGECWVALRVTSASTSNTSRIVSLSISTPSGTVTGGSWTVTTA